MGKTKISHVNFSIGHVQPILTLATICLCKQLSPQS